MLVEVRRKNALYQSRDTATALVAGSESLLRHGFNRELQSERVKKCHCCKTFPPLQRRLVG
eukprot:2395093-Prorocentrum_lima.AAC.1